MSRVGWGEIFVLRLLGALGFLLILDGVLALNDAALILQQQAALSLLTLGVVAVGFASIGELLYKLGNAWLKQQEDPTRDVVKADEKIRPPASRKETAFVFGMKVPVKNYGSDETDSEAPTPEGQHKRPPDP